jgi:hypothetical protein
MNTQGRVGFVALAIAFAAGLGCSSDNQTGTHDITFMGAVIDGAAGTPINGYSISLVYGSHTIKGKVDATTGRYVLGPFPAWNDYGILIDAGTGYRAFSSYNAGIAPPAPPTTSLSADIYKANTSQVFDFDATLFPTSVTTPDIAVTVVKTGPMAATGMAAAGNYRLQPITLSPSIQTAPSEVGTQSWSNDNDLFAAVVSGTFMDGKFSVMGGNLLFGVNYQITVYGVDGFQPGGGTVAAGSALQAMISVSPQTLLPLAMLSSTANMCMATTSLAATSTAVVTFTFNQDIEDGTLTAGGGKEALDNGVSAYTANFYTPHTSVSSSVQERGTSFVISGSTLTISFNPSVGITSPITTDTLASLTYSGLSSITLQPIGHPEQKAVLSTLIGTPSISCIVN